MHSDRLCSATVAMSYWSPSMTKPIKVCHGVQIAKTFNLKRPKINWYLNLHLGLMLTGLYGTAAILSNWCTTLPGAPGAAHLLGLELTPHSSSLKQAATLCLHMNMKVPDTGTAFRLYKENKLTTRWIMMDKLKVTHPSLPLYSTLQAILSIWCTEFLLGSAPPGVPWDEPVLGLEWTPQSSQSFGYTLPVFNQLQL